MSAPVNMKLENPTIDVKNWSQQAEGWRKLNAEVGGNDAFYPLTIKAAYVIGVIHKICQSVEWLLQHPNAREVTYIPAYGIFAAALELLGRCINGDCDVKGDRADLSTGLEWVVKSSHTSVSDCDVLIETSTGRYTIGALKALRHFAAHGQAVSFPSPSSVVDYEILEQMPPKIANGLERYWNQLQSDDELCNKLALANVLQLHRSNILLSWKLFERDSFGHYSSMTELFERFKWRV